MCKQRIRWFLDGLVVTGIVLFVCTILGIPLAAWFFQWGGYHSCSSFTWSGECTGSVIDGHIIGTILMGVIWGGLASIGLVLGFGELWCWSHSEDEEGETEVVGKEDA